MKLFQIYANTLKIIAATLLLNCNNELDINRDYTRNSVKFTEFSLSDGERNEMFCERGYTGDNCDLCSSDFIRNKSGLCEAVTDETFKFLNRNISLSQKSILWEDIPYNMISQWHEDTEEWRKYFTMVAKYSPDLVSGFGFKGNTLVPFWSGANVVPRGVHNSIYGDTYTGNTGRILDAGLLPPEDLQIRINELQNYNAQFNRITTLFPHLDISTAIFGNHITRTGFWEFYDNCSLYADSFGFKCNFSDPTEWLLRSWDPNRKQWDNLPDELAGLRFNYSPIKNTYHSAAYIENPSNPTYYRYSVDMTSPSYNKFFDQVIEWTARAGYDGAFLDNSHFQNCWNNSCEEGFSEWLTEKYGARIKDKVLKRGEKSFLWNHDFEIGWVKNNGLWETPHVRAVRGTLKPSTNSYHGLYSGELKASDEEGELAFSTFNRIPEELQGQDFTIKLHYKTRYTTREKTNPKILIDNISTLVTRDIEPSSRWAYYQTTVFVPANAIRIRFITPPHSTLWVDEVIVSPANSLPIEDRRLLARDEEIWNFEGKLRQHLTVKYWDSVFRDKIPYLCNAGKEINPKFELFLNSYVPVKDAKYSMVERQLHEFENSRMDVGHRPGLYEPGITNGEEHKLRRRVVASNTINTNIFDYTYFNSKRIPDYFSYVMFLNQPVESYYALNKDTAFLKLAETFAFSGGGGSNFHLGYNYGHYNDEERDALIKTARNFRRFLNSNPELYDGLQPYSEIAFVITSINSLNSGNEILDIASGLTKKGIPYSIISEENSGLDNFNKHRVLIYHDVPRLSEREAKDLIKFIRKGGTVIRSGNVGSFDEFFRIREAMERTVWPPIAYSPNKIVRKKIGRGSYISIPTLEALGGENIDGKIDNEDIEALVSLIQDRLKRNPSYLPAFSEEGSELYIKPWIGCDRMVLHFLNYNVPHGKEKVDMVEQFKNVTVTMPLPGGFVPNEVKILSPEADEFNGNVAFNVANSLLTFKIPRVRIYAVAKISIK